MARMFIVGVDVGGTFTDLTAVEVSHPVPQEAFPSDG
jgi:N-methylhydantoinase A/oxoprolinase/acetone carboxylase beta subunit